MTDYKKLIERLRTDSAFDFTTLGNEAADAIEALQSKLGDAIQSSAHWQHQCTELQSRLDAMGKGEPVGWFIDVTVHGKSVGDFQLAARDYWGDYSVCQPLYAAPKALAPLTDEQIQRILRQFGWCVDGIGEYTNQKQVTFARVIEAAHGIHAKGGQHEDAN